MLPLTAAAESCAQPSVAPVTADPFAAVPAAVPAVFGAFDPGEEWCPSLRECDLRPWDMERFDELAALMLGATKGADVSSSAASCACRAVIRGEQLGDGDEKRREPPRAPAQRPPWNSARSLRRAASAGLDANVQRARALPSCCCSWRSARRVWPSNSRRRRTRPAGIFTQIAHARRLHSDFSHSI